MLMAGHVVLGEHCIEFIGCLGPCFLSVRAGALQYVVHILVESATRKTSAVHGVVHFAEVFLCWGPAMSIL